MVSLFRAEWQKIVGNRLAVAGLVWIFPMTAGLLMVFALFAALLSEQFRSNVAAQPPLWTEGMLGIWGFANSPFLLQPLILAFTAIVFAGEYQWGMWKNLLPRSRRAPLILTKFAAIAVFVVLSFTAMTVVVGIGQGIVTVASGASYGPAITGDVLADFIPRYLAQGALAFANVLIACGYTAIAAMATRSILGGVLIGFLIALAEWALLIPVALLVNLFNLDAAGWLQAVTPSYNLQNLTTFAQTGQASPLLLQPDVALDPTVSLLIVLGWIALLIGLTVLRFRRQEIMA